MNTHTHTIAAIITCHNRKEKTFNCIKAIFEQKKAGLLFKVTVFLVDDGSTDGTQELIKKEFPEVNIINGTGNLYWNRGMHLAWTKAAEDNDYDYFLWLNDDTIPFPSAISEMLNCHISLQSDAIICGSTKSGVTQKFTYGGHTIDGNPIEPNGEIQECRIMNGNCVLISRNTFKKVGFIDKIFPHAIGDYDYGLRAHKHNIKIVIPKNYIAICEPHERLPEWCLPDVPIKKRLKKLYSPLAYSHPYYFFIYEKRHWGFTTAVKHYISIHLRALIPSLWK